jgi:hypothetical protein
MSWRGAGRNKKYSNSAFMPIVATIMTLSIVTGSVGTIVAFSVSTIDEQNEENETSNALNYFNYFSNTISKSISDRSGDKTSIRISDLKGNLKMDNNNYDRTIITYTFYDEYDFTISGLDNKVYEFEILFSGNVNNPYAILYDSSIADDPKYICPLEIINTNIISIEPFVGSKLIDLYTWKDNEGILFGKIWLFDSNSLIYSNLENNNKLILEKASLIFEEAGNVQIKNSPLINIHSSTINFHISQTLTEKLISAGYSNVNQGLYLTNNGSAIREAGLVYNLRFYFYNSHADWVDYFNKIFNIEYTFFDKESEDSLLFLPSQNGIWFTLFHSIIDFDLN